MEHVLCLNRVVSIWLLVPSVLLADYTAGLGKIAGRLARQIPKGEKVVVFNLVGIEFKGATRLGVDLAVELGTKLARASRGKFKIIERVAGESLWLAERMYTVGEEDPKALAQLIGHFRASLGLVGSYSIVGQQLILEQVRAIRIPSPEQPPEVVATSDRMIIKLDSLETQCLMARERPLPLLPDEKTRFFLEAATNHNFITRAGIVDTRGRPLANNCARIGSYYRLEVEINEDVYLYVFDYYQDQNRVFLLHPENLDGMPPNPQGRVLIPEPETGLGFLAEEPAGSDYLRIFACRKPLAFTIPPPARRELTHEEFARFVQELRHLPEEDWSSWSMYLHIVR